MGPWAHLWYIFLISDWCGRIQCTVGTGNPWEVVSGYIKMQAEGTMRRNKAVSSIFFFLVVSVSVPVYSFLPCWVPASACLHDHLSQINFSFQVSFGHGVYHHSRWQSIRGWNSHSNTSSKCPWKLCQLKLSYRKSMLKGTSVHWPNLSNVCSVTLN